MSASAFSCDSSLPVVDDLLEAEDAAGNPVGKERLLERLRAEVPNKAGHIAGQLQLHLGAPAHDDMSVILAPCRFRQH